ncbi:MAG TPA: ferredoxin [Mycobacteriales bacterium]|jgi:ferredoxin|nr:ferredoxin [Mycobacteriales bacterium]
MADYLTRPPIPAQHPVPPPPPVRRPTTPIPSAARSRKPPKEPVKPPLNRAGRMRLRVNPITCDGHGICAELLPELVTLDDWGYPAPIVAEIPAELESHAQRAAQQCPTLAIVLERRHPKQSGA